MHIRANVELRCSSCHYNCEVSPNLSIKASNCLDQQYCIWPEQNQYLKTGILSLLLNDYYNLLGCGFIFVDFSYYNIKIFSNADWATWLTRTNFRLILIADKKMEALASYWQKCFSHVVAVIYADDSHQSIRKKISNAFLGRRTVDVKRHKLTALEITVLDLLIRGIPVKGIAQLLNMKEKSVYNIRGTLKTKMGGRINNIIAG